MNDLTCDAGVATAGCAGSKRATGAAGPMHLNAKIRESSAGSELIILNLPDPDTKAKERPERYMRYVEMLTKNLDRVLLIHGSGKEV